MKRFEEKQEEHDEKDLISSLPRDLMIQILVSLPLKTIAKLISVSKLWSSILRGKDFTDFFLSQSSTRPSFLFPFKSGSNRGFHSCSQEEPSFSGNRRTSLVPYPFHNTSSSVRGLICGQDSSDDALKVICNPTTGQFVTLPRLNTWGRHPNNISHFLGYDPISNVYKVLSIVSPQEQQHQVFTLGGKTWRRIQCKHPHCPATNEICRDGVVYYGAWYNSPEEGFLIVSFDVRSEDFGVINLPKDVKIQCGHGTNLVNYNGKLALVDLSFCGHVYMWVLQDVKKQEWSKISILLPRTTERTETKVFYCRGTISTGELIFAPSWFAKPYFILYYDLKEHNARRVYIEGLKDIVGPVTVDHVESPMFLS